MLLWAMWLATSLLKWMKWGWAALTTGEFWMKKPEAETKAKINNDNTNDAESLNKAENSLNAEGSNSAEGSDKTE